MIEDVYVQVISTRSVNGLVKALGMDEISKSQLRRLSEQRAERVKPMLDSPTEDEWPYLCIDAGYVKARQNGQTTSVVVIVATGLNSDCRRRRWT